MKRNILLVNLGSPQSPHPSDVGVYLRQFLMDPFVIDISPALRWFLVHVLIVPRRKFKSAEAYEKIWTPAGSPLVVHTRDFATKLQEFNKGLEIRWGMRYGGPSLDQVLKQWLKETPEPIDVVPLYPQYAKSSTGTCIEVVRRVGAQLGANSRLRVLQDFFDQHELCEAFAVLLTEKVREFRPDKVLFSFHGLPEHHVTETDLSSAHCLKKKKCCDQVCEVNRLCYRAQSFATARGVAAAAKINDYQVSFQSRLGRRPWIKPYTDVVLQDLANQGFKRVLVCCPSFVADCLETLEEIQIRAREDFIKFGGEDLQLVPSLNASEEWVQNFDKLLNRSDLDWVKL